jgi:hypothetical protein
MCFREDAVAQAPLSERNLMEMSLQLKKIKDGKWGTMHFHPGVPSPSLDGAGKYP